MEININDIDKLCPKEYEGYLFLNSENKAFGHREDRSLIFKEYFFRDLGLCNPRNTFISWTPNIQTILDLVPNKCSSFYKVLNEDLEKINVILIKIINDKFYI